MPRTYTPTERALATGDANHHQRLTVANAVGASVELTNYFGVNFLDAASFSSDVNTPVDTATFRLRRDVTRADDTLVSIAPLMSASPANTGGPLLWVGRTITYETATTAPGVAPVSGDWKTRLVGLIMEVDPGADREDQVLVSVADLGARLGRIAVNDQSVYGTPNGRLLELVLQDILNAHAPGVTLHVPIATEFAVHEFELEQTYLLDALRNLALQSRGMDVRYRFHGAEQTPRLTLWEPPRDQTTPDLSLTASEYDAVQRMPVSLVDIRNRAVVRYVDGETDELKSVEVVDAASIAEYGDAYMEFTEDAVSQIDTEAEARALGEAAVSDLGQPWATIDVDVPDLWMVQLGDVLSLAPNGRVFDYPQTVAVQAIHWEHTATTNRMTLTVRGRPSGSYRAWLEREQLGGFDAQPQDISLGGLRYTDDETTRRYYWTRGRRVEFVWIYNRLLPIPVDAAAWPDPSELPDATLQVGEDSFIVEKPQAGFQRVFVAVPFYRRGTGYRRGPAAKAVLDPTPAAFAGVLTVQVSGDLADLTAHATAGPADWPLTFDVFEEDVDAAPIVSMLFTADGTRTKIDHAALGSRPLPLREIVRWFGRLTNAAGDIRWTAPVSADRDPRPTVTVERHDFRPTASIEVDYDDDTDQIQIVLPNGATVTSDALFGSGIFEYIVGIDVLDGGGIEAPLGVDEARTPYVIRALGGTEWIEVTRLTLHGTPAQPPTVRPRVVTAADGSAESIYALLESYADEHVTLRVREGDDPGAPIYYLVVGAGDDDPLFVTSGTEIGPAHFFTEGVGSPVAKLSDVPLTRDQIRRFYLQAIGEDSGVEGAWVPVALSLLEAPYLEGFALTFDAASRTLRARATGGPHCQSVAIIVDDDPAFGTPLSAHLAALDDGDEVTATWTLSGAQLGKVWRGRATPYNLPGQTGLSGGALVDEVAVPATFAHTLTIPANDTVRVVVDDAGDVIDPAVRVRFYVTGASGVRTLHLPTNAPVPPVTTGTYDYVATLDDKHATLVEPFITLRDGSVVTLGAQTLDADVVATIVDTSVAYVGQVGTVTATLDSDVATGNGMARYSTNNGASWIPLAVSSSRVVQFALSLSTIAKTPVLVQAQDGANNWGQAVALELSQYAAPPAAQTGPTLSVTKQPGTLADTISYAFGGSASYYVNGAPSVLPSSPFSVTRPAAGSTPISLTFSVFLNGQTVTEEVSVFPIDSNTVSPDVQLQPLAPSGNTLPFVAYATNPALGAGAYVNATFTFSDCSGTVNGTFVAPGGSHTTLANGISVVANQPAIGAKPGTLRMRATLAGGGAAEISRTISEQTKDFTPPTFDPTYSTTTSTATASWTVPAAGVSIYARQDSGGWVLQYDGFSVFNTSFSMSRNPAGGASRTMALRAVASNGATNEKTFTVDPEDPVGGGGGPVSPAVYGLYGYGETWSGNIFLQWTATAFPVGGSFQIYTRRSNSAGWGFATSTSNEFVATSPVGYSFDNTGDLLPNSVSWVEFEVRMLNASAQVVATQSLRMDDPIPVF